MSPRPSVPTVRYFAFAFRPFWAVGIFFLVLLTAGLAAGALAPLDIRQFFFDPDKGTVLHFATDKPTGTVTRYVITDYLGKEIADGKAEATGGSWEVPVNLPAGYYDLALPDLGQAYGLASIRRYEGTPDPFFCMDTGLSWLAPEPMREPYVQLLKRCGVAMARERLSWASIHPTEGAAAWNWNADRAFDRTRQLYHNNGIPILELAHSAPPRFTPRTGMVWPDRLVGAANDWTTIAKKWSPLWGALESWNEPDMDDIPPDQYVSWAKALHSAVRSAGADTPLGGGVFAYLNRPYMDSAARNGLLNESNFVSFHFYGQPAGLEGEVAEFRRWLDEFKRPEMPLWITEAGAFWSGSPTTRAPAALIQTSAMKIVGNAVEAKACGIARYFPFVYVNYSENGKNNFGMLDLNGTPTRSMAGYAAAMQILGNKNYVGDLPIADPRIKRARVFSSGDDQAVVALYTGGVEPGRPVPLPFPARQVLGIDGRTLKTDEPQSIPIPDGLGYVLVSLDTVKDLLKTDTGTLALTKLGRGTSVSSPAPASIVLKPVLTDASLTGSKRGYSVAEGVKKLPLSILAANLEPTAREVQLTFSDGTDHGTVLTTASGTVPAAGSALLSAEIDLASLHPNGAGIAQVRVEASSAGTDPIAPVVMDFLPAHGLEEYLRQYAYHFALPLGEQHRWSVNVGATGSMTFEHGPEAQWGFSVKFSGGDRWVFPRYVLPQEVKLDRVQGVLIRARCMQRAIVRVMAWTENATTVMTPYSIIPSDGAWHVNFVPFDGLTKDNGGVWESKTAAGLTTISIGMNSQTDKNQLEVSDLYLVGK